MPIYDFECKDNECGNKFEKLILSPNKPESIKCPICGSETNKMMSVPAEYPFG